MLAPDISGEVVLRAAGRRVSDCAGACEDSYGRRKGNRCLHDAEVANSGSQDRSGGAIRRIRPLVTGQRILDTLFPIAKGGKTRRSGRLWNGKDHDAASAREVV